MAGQGAARGDGRGFLKEPERQTGGAQRRLGREGEAFFRFSPCTVVVSASELPRLPASVLCNWCDALSQLGRFPFDVQPRPLWCGFLAFFEP